MRTILLAFIAAITLYSCKDDDTQTPAVEVTDIGIATGVVLTDANGQGIGSVGNPNWYNGLILYPNPPADVQTAALQSGEGIREVNIIPAVKNTDFTSAEVMDAFNQFEGYTSSEIISASTRTINIQPSSAQRQYDLSGLAAGYYRVIVTSEAGDQHGSTIFVDSTLTYPTGILDFLNSEW